MSRRLSTKDLALLKNDLGAELPPPAPRKKRDNEEWRIQSDFFAWWRAACRGLGVFEHLCHHVPNGSMLGDNQRSRVIRAKMLAQAGVMPGVPDVFLAVPVTFRNGDEQCPDVRFSGLYLEFKTPKWRERKNGGLSDSQMEFMGFALARGYQAAVAYSWEEGRDEVLKYLNKPDEERPAGRDS